MTNKTPKHSPLPWKLKNQDECQDLIDKNGNYIWGQAGTFIYTKDADFTLRAVNSFYPMLEALKNAQKSLDPFDTDDETLLMIQEAIKLAENED